LFTRNNDEDRQTKIEATGWAIVVEEEEETAETQVGMLHPALRCA